MRLGLFLAVAGYRGTDSPMTYALSPKKDSIVKVLVSLRPIAQGFSGMEDEG